MQFLKRALPALALLLLAGCLPGAGLGDLVITAISPDRGPATGGVEVTVTGEEIFEVLGGGGFPQTLRVLVCGAPLRDLVVQGEVRTLILPPAGNVTIRVGKTVTGVTSAAQSNSRDVVVIRPDGQQAVLENAFSCRQEPPTADPQSVTTLEDTPVSITLTGSDPDGDPLGYAVVTDPASGTLSGTAPSLGYTPAQDVNGSDSFTFKVDDGTTDSAPATVDITITPVNDPPSFTAGPDQSLPAGTTAAQSVPGWASAISFGPADESGQAVADFLVAVTSDPAGIFTTPPDVADDGTLTFTPNGTAGSATVSVVLQDDGGTADGGVDTSAAATFTISVLAPTPPTAVGDGPFAIEVGSTLSLSAASGLLANDDRGFPLAALTGFGGGDLGGSVTDNTAGASVALAGGTLTVNADGSLFLTAPATAGSYGFSYRIQNAAGFSDATVSIEVRVAPVARDDAFAMVTGATLTGDLDNDNGSGADDPGNPAGSVAGFGGGSLGGTVTDNAAGASVPLAGGTLTVNADGGFSLVSPTTGGVYTFQYRLTNAVGFSDATVTITIQAPPVAQDDGLSAALGGVTGLPAETLFVDNGSGADDRGFPSATVVGFGGGSLGGVVTDNAAGASVAFAGGTLAVNGDGSLVVSNPTATGTFTFLYRIQNPSGFSDATVTITVTEAPIAQDDAYSFLFSVDQNVAAGAGLFVDNGSGADNLGNPPGTLTSFGGGSLGGVVTDNAVGASVALAGGTLTVNADGSWSLTGQPFTAGTYTFEYRLSNANGSSDATVTLTIQAPPVAQDDAFSVVAGATLTVAAPGLFADNGSGADDLGTPAATVVGFGGGSLGGVVTDNAAGASIALAGGTLTVNGDGSFTLTTPTTPGNYTFLYRIQNAAGFSDATVSIQVQGPPSAVDDTVAGGSVPGDAFHTALNTTLNAANGSAQDLDGNDTLGVPAGAIVNFGGGSLGGVVTDNAAGATVTFGAGSLTVNADGSFGFTPDTNFTGLFTFQYRLENVAGADDATVTLAVGVRPAAAADGFGAIGNVGLVAGSNDVRGNDAGDRLTVTQVQGAAGNVGVSAATTAGASVTLNANGTFSYQPAAGYEGADTFTYAVGNGFGDSAAATVTITVTDVVWFIDNSAGGSNAGTLADPFQSIGAFNGTAAVEAGDHVYLAETGTSYTTGIDLKADVRLIGEGATGASLAALLSLTVPTGTPALPGINGIRPVIVTTNTSGVDLAQNNTVRGIAVGSTGTGAAFKDAGNVGTLTIADVVVSGTGGILDLQNGGTLAATFLDLASTSSTTAIRLNNMGGSLTVSDGAGLETSISGATNGIDVQNAAGASFDFGETSVASSGTGVNLNNAAGAGFTFDGLAITTTAGSGLVATNAGTVSVTGAANTVNAIGGVGVSLTNTTIGAAGVTFRSVAVNNAAKGIVLNNAGSGFTVTGTGTTDASGGTIQNITGRGIEVVSTNSVALSNMALTSANTSDGAGSCDAFTNTGCNAAIYLNTVTGATLTNVDVSGTTAQQGINGLGVANFTLTNSTLTSCGDEVNEGCLRIRNLSGTSAITGSNLSFPAERVAQIENDSGTLALSVSGSTFRDTQSSGFGADGLEILNRGTANTTVDIVNSSFLRNRTNGLQVFAEGSSVVSADVTGSTFDRGAGIGIGLDLAADDTAQLDFNVIGNPLINSRGGSAVNVFADGTATVQGRINNNPSIQAGGAGTSGFGIRVQANTNSTVKVEIDNNTIGSIGFDAGIEVISRLAGSSRLDAVINNNTITVDALSLYDIWVQSGSGAPGESNTTCANVTNNSASDAGVAAFRVRESAGTLLLQGFTTDAATTWANNGNTPTTAGAVSESPAGSASGGTCNTVSHPLP